MRVVADLTIGPPQAIAHKALGNAQEAQRLYQVCFVSTPPPLSDNDGCKVKTPVGPHFLSISPDCTFCVRALRWTAASVMGCVRQQPRFAAAGQRGGRPSIGGIETRAPTDGTRAVETRVSCIHRLHLHSAYSCFVRRWGCGQRC